MTARPAQPSRTISPGDDKIDRLSRQLSIEIRRLIREGGHHDRGLLRILEVYPVGRVHVRVMCADVVIPVVLDWVEPVHAGIDEAQMIGGADRLDDVAAGANRLERLEPAVENR